MSAEPEAPVPDATGPDATGPDATGRGASNLASPEPGTVDGLTRVLAKACRQLGDAGHPKEAAALAAQGWVLLRKTHPKQADRLDGAMHYLARQEAKLAAE